MIFEALDRLGSKADRVLFYPDHWDLHISSKTDRDSQMLVLARDRYNAKLIPVQDQKILVEFDEGGELGRSKACHKSQTENSAEAF